MNFTKAFTNKKEISEFKKNYSNLTIKSEVISNLYNSHIKPEKFTELFKFLDNQDDFFYLNILASTVADMALTESFGKYDFKFYANRCYKIWLLKFNDDIFMVPAQREVIIKDKLDKNTIDNSIEFEKAFLNDDKMYREYQQREDAIREETTRFNKVKREAREKGKAEGKAEEKIQNAINFLRLGLDIKTVAIGTGLSIEKVNELNNQLTK